MEDLLSDVYVAPKLATIGSRFGAALLDFILLVILFVIFGKLWGETSYEDGWHVNLSGLPALAYYALGFVLMPLQEGISGKTLGKRVMGIHVKRKDNSDAGVGLSIARHIFDGIDCLFLVGIIVAASNQYRQRIGDLVAGTIVVKD